MCSFAPTSSSRQRWNVKTTVDTYGALDVASNNAGILPPTGPVLDRTEADWDKTLAVGRRSCERPWLRVSSRPA